MERVILVARSFQAGTGGVDKEFDADLFEKAVALPISRVLKAEEVVQSVVVIVNGEPFNHLAEIKDSKETTPTMIAIQERFPGEIVSGRVIVNLCTN